MAYLEDIEITGLLFLLHSWIFSIVSLALQALDNDSHNLHERFTMFLRASIP